MILRSLAVCAAVLIAMLAFAQSSWDRQNDPSGSTYGSRDRDRGTYGTRRSNWTRWRVIKAAISW